MYCPNPECPDLLETGVPGEYREGTTHCPYCGTALAPGEPPRAPEDGAGGEAGKIASHEVTVFLARDPTEAAMIAGLLEEHGIPCFQRVEGLHGEPALFSARWAPVPGQRYEIVVGQASEREARRLLEDTLGPGAGSTGPPQPPPPGPPAGPDAVAGDPVPGDSRHLFFPLLLGLLLLAGVIAWLLRSFL